MYSSYKMHSDDVFSLLPKLTSDGGTSKEEDYDIDASTLAYLCDSL
jgi:hypothetical protein